MRNPKPKIKIVLASILAGGGHNALRDYLFEELSSDKRFTIVKFTHSDSSYNFINDFVFGRFTRLYDAFYKRLPNEYPALSAIKLIKECEDFVNRENPDIVISTNFGVGSAFCLIKKTLKLKYININAIPDYGKPTAVVFPRNRYLKSDYALVFDEQTKRGLINELHYPANKIFVSGYTASKSFTKDIAINSKLSRQQIVRELGFNIAPNKRTIILTGGAGGIIHKADKLLRSLAHRQNENPELLEQLQILVITGLNEKYYKQLNQLHNNYQQWSNIIPIPWIDHQKYANLQILAEFPILVTIAPATINELIQSHCGPLIIYQSRRGQEKANIDFVLLNKLGRYIPKTNEVLDLIIRGIPEKQKQDFKQKADTYVAIRRQLVKDLAMEIEKIYYRSRLAQSRKPRRKIIPDLNLNLSLISPKTLLTIFVLLVPASMIFSYAQYYKGKHKVKDSRIVNLLVKYLGKIKSVSNFVRKPRK